MEIPKHRIVTIRCGGQAEEWLVVYQDGRIQHHSENDGYRFLRRGAEARDEWINFDHVRWCWPHLVGEVQAALDELTHEDE